MENKKKKTPEEELVESIGLMVDSGVAGTTKIYSGVVKSSDGKTAKVAMNGQEQNVAVSSSDLSIGSLARVFVPGGNMSNAFILGSVSGGGGDDPTPTKKNDGVAGTYIGSDARSKTLTFSFEPKFVAVVGVTTGASVFDEMGFMIKGCPISKIISNSSYSYAIDVTWGTNSVTFSSSAYYFNSSSNTYYYFAI